MERHEKTEMRQPVSRNAKAPLSRGYRVNLGGKPGIRTLETLLTSAGFQDRYANISTAPLNAKSVPLFNTNNRAGDRILQGMRF
jgi:hypothetical protein